MIAAREYTPANVAEMRANAVAVRARCFYPKAAPKQKPSQVVTLRRPEAKIANQRKPSWMTEPTYFDHHLGAKARYLLERAEIGGHRLKKYIRDRAEEMGLTYSEVISKSRIKTRVRARDLIIYEIKTTVKPGISFPELGRLFGNRDHTTALHSYCKIKAEFKSQKEASA